MRTLAPEPVLHPLNDGFAGADRRGPFRFVTDEQAHVTLAHHRGRAVPFPPL